MRDVGADATLARLPGQFDHVDGTASLAVPTCGGCCCCCCCCVATIATTPIVLGTVAADRAARDRRPRSGPITLAVAAFPVGTAAAFLGGAVVEEPVGALLGPVVAIVMVALALGAGDPDRRAGAIGAAVLAGIVVPVAFVAEAIGAIALLFASADGGGSGGVGGVAYLAIAVGIVAMAGWWSSRRAAGRDARGRPGPGGWAGAAMPAPSPPMTTPDHPWPRSLPRSAGPPPPGPPAPPPPPAPTGEAAPWARPAPGPTGGEPDGGPAPWARPPDETTEEPGP